MPTIIDEKWVNCGKRKPIPKSLRLKVYDKYRGHCAYCGKEIAMKDMQVDPYLPVFVSDTFSDAIWHNNL